MTFSVNDHAFMARALALAKRGLNTTTPNPRVGCVLVKHGQIIGEGWHQRAGEAHAEIYALQAAGENAHGATAYVTLEPCSHQGRTPPCTTALIKAGVTHVIAAIEDPNPHVAGQGFACLKKAGIQTEYGLLAEEAIELNIGFISRMRHNRPWVRLKAAATLDGKTALSNGVSQWITCEAARLDGHRWRARACAILTGIGTVKTDNPQLTVRHVPTERQPKRILLDSQLEVSPQAAILSGDPILIATTNEDTARHAIFIANGHQILVCPSQNGKIDLPWLMNTLAKQGLNEIHVEAGATLNGALLQAGCVDELLLYFAPILVGNTAQGLFNIKTLHSLDQATHLKIIDNCNIGTDIRLIARPV